MQYYNSQATRPFSQEYNSIYPQLGAKSNDDSIRILYIIPPPVKKSGAVPIPRPLYLYDYIRLDREGDARRVPYAGPKGSLAKSSLGSRVSKSAYLLGDASRSPNKATYQDGGS